MEERKQIRKEKDNTQNMSFMKRWKKGIREITPLQMLRINLNSYWFIIIGIVWGLLSSLYNKTYWLVIILLGSLFVSILSMLSMYNKYQTLKKIKLNLEEQNV